MRKQEPTEEDPSMWGREGSILLEVGCVYPLVEVPNPFDPEGGAPWLAIAEPVKYVRSDVVAPGDLLGLNRYALVFGPRSLCQIIETAPPTRQVPALLRT